MHAVRTPQHTIVQRDRGPVSNTPPVALAALLGPWVVGAGASTLGVLLACVAGDGATDRSSHPFAVQITSVTEARIMVCNNRFIQIAEFRDTGFEPVLAALV
ncbi:MAG TPA: hypothetical protein VH518_14305 [Tepidisphaeraceae bacterium]|jgi:hypothetical protein